MATKEAATDRAESPDFTRPVAVTWRFDWGVTVLAAWVIAGFYADLWAHAHGRVDDTFLTPWHAILYSGALTFGLTLGFVAARNMGRGIPWRLALPRPYLVSLAGTIGFVISGQVDFAWHSLFGFEVSVEALLSPAHLALAVSGIVALSGPVRSVWSRGTAAPVSWRLHGPAVVGLTLMLSIFAAFTQYAHPIVDPRAEAVTGSGARGPVSQLYAMAADGTDQHRVVITDEDNRNPQLSPDGRRLAFDASADGSTQIVVSDADGVNPHPVTTESRSGGASWSPDGTRIAFHSDRAGSLDIYTMAADGTDVRQVTTEPSTDLVATWAPDGATIAFSSDRDGPFSIYSARADGSNVVKLTEGPAGAFDPDWSPDGTHITFGSEQADGELEVVSMAADGTDLRRLTDAQGASYLPAWSPDGKSIAFATDRDGDLEVYAMNADGTNQRNLTRNPGLKDGWYGPSWSPDGTAILYPSEAEGVSGRAEDLRDALGAASIIIQAALLAAFALVALRRGPLPFGALTLLMFVPTALMTVVSDEYRFLPGALIAGLLVDLSVRRRRYGLSRRTDAVIACAIPAAFYLAYFVTLQITGGIGWTIHLWLGAIVIAGIVGVALDTAMRIRPARPASPR
jgi:Tol biopolymer transport system component